MKLLEFYSQFSKLEIMKTLETRLSSVKGPCFIFGEREQVVIWFPSSDLQVKLTIRNALIKIRFVRKGKIWTHTTPWNSIKILKMVALVCGFGQILSNFNNGGSTPPAKSLHFTEIWPEFALLSKMVMLTRKSSINNETLLLFDQP